MQLQPVRLGTPTLPLSGPLNGDLILGQALPRAHMHLTQTVIDPRLQTKRSRQRRRRRQRPP